MVRAMYVSHKLKLVFIRVPKTGSTTVVESLKTIDPNFEHEHWVHAKIKEIPLENLERARGYRRFGFVRHPLKWLPSYFNMCKRNHGHRIAETGIDRMDSPSEFLRALKHTPIDWFLDADGHIAVDKVYVTDRMPEFFFDFGLEPSWQNPTRAEQRVEIDWSPEDLAFIKERFARELAYC